MTEDAFESPPLSKSTYLAGLQCPRLLWVHYNDTARLQDPDPGLEFRFAQGRLVGEMARRLFPDGFTIDWDVGISEVLRQSREALAERRPLFEAGFVFEHAFTRADVLVPAGKRKWDVVEVKSTGEVKEEHIEDVAFQRYVCEGAGVPIRRCHVMHVNTGYVRYGDVDAGALFTRVDVTREVKALLPKIGRRIRKMHATIAKPTCPRVKVGARCSSPHDCPLEDECWSFLPERNVFTLVSGGRKAWTLMGTGILALKDIPDDFKLSARQEIQVRAVKRRKVIVNRKRLRAFLNTLRYPLYLLDFETAATPIPLYDRCRPYQQIPFQYSVHVVDRPGQKPRHFAFLPRSGKDPRPMLLGFLRDRLGESGSIVAYYASFERQRLRECARDYPEHAGWVDSVLPRIVDLWPPFRSLHYYHPSQHGSASLKVVMPALTGRGYDDLDVTDGLTAGRLFLDMVYGGLSRRDKHAIREQLKAYCGRDTEGMIWIIDRLRELAWPAQPGRKQ